MGRGIGNLRLDRIVALAVLAMASLPASARGEIGKGNLCAAEAQANLTVAEHYLSPRSGSSFWAGSTITFSDISRESLDFAVASSASLLPDQADIDRGQGSPGPPSGESYAFTSTKAAASARIIYWDASFSTAGLPSCAGEAPKTEATEPQAVAVFALPPLPPTSEQPAPIAVSLVAPPRFRLAHREITFQVRCTTWCVGSAGYEVSLRTPHKQVTRVPHLDASPVPFSITSVNGTWTFTRHLTRAVARSVGRLLRRHDAVTLKMGVRVIDQAGHAATAQQRAHLVA